MRTVNLFHFVRPEGPKRSNSYHDNIHQVRVVQTTGLFHGWGADYEEFETGPGNYTVAIVELPDGSIVTPIPENIEFVDEEELEDE